MKDVNKKMALGAVWMVSFRLADRGLGLVSTIILARLLAPSDFGIIAMAMSIIAVLELFSEFNFDVALIQNQDAERRHYDTAWTLNVLIAAAISVAMVILAVPTAHFFDEPRVAKVIFFLALGTLLRGAENIGVVAFRKELEFNKEFWYRFGQRLAGFLVTVPLAYFLRSYWALVIGVLVWRTAGVILSYLVQGYRPRFSLAAKQDLFHFSKWLFFSNVSAVAMLRSSHFVVGKMTGPQGLGIYTVGYDISNLPTTELVAPINRAVFPGYAKMSHDLTILRQGYLNVIAVIALVSIPAGIGIAATAELVVKVVLGDKWLEAIPIMGVLAFHGALQAIQSNLYSVYLALGKPKLLTIISAIYLVVFLCLLIMLTGPFGIVGAAWSCAISSAVILPVNYVVAFRQLNLRLMQFLAYVWRPVLAAGLMYAIVRAFLIWGDVLTSDAFQTQVLGLAMAVALGIVSYVLLVFGLWKMSSSPPGAEQVILEKLLERLRSKK